MANPTKAAPNGERVEGIDLDVLDTRLTEKKIEWSCEWLKGGAPNRRFRVDEDTPLDTFLLSVKSFLKNKSASDNWVYEIGVLRILAHGLALCEYKNRDDYRKAQGKCNPQGKDVKAHLGFGIEFCKDGINLETVEKFKSLNGLFYRQDAVGIELIGCGAASEESFFSYPNSTVKEQTFGNRLCKKLAEVTGTCVKASEAVQTVQGDPNIYTLRRGNKVETVSGCVRWGDLTGQVWIFKPDG
jgi:hypothetical protein